MKRFYAKWNVPSLPVELDIDTFHISAGIDSEKDNIDDQVPGFFPYDRDAHLTFVRLREGWRVTLSAPTQGLEEQDGYWLSPNLAFDEVEAYDWGLR